MIGPDFNDRAAWREFKRSADYEELNDLMLAVLAEEERKNPPAPPARPTASHVWDGEAWVLPTPPLATEVLPTADAIEEEWETALPPFLDPTGWMNPWGYPYFGAMTQAGGAETEDGDDEEEDDEADHLADDAVDSLIASEAGANHVRLHIVIDDENLDRIRNAYAHYEDHGCAAGAAILDEFLARIVEALEP